MSVPVFLVGADVLRADSDWIRLDGDEGRHAAVVRRIAVGERVELTDGVGNIARCVVAAVDKAGLTCDIESRFDEPPPVPRLVVVQALPKGDRGETAVETMTEVGVDEIVPWAAARCVTRWQGERGEKALRKWRVTAREAAKQARRAWVPQVSEAASTAAVAARLRAAPLAIVLHEEAPTSLASVKFPDAASDAAEIAVVVGPEGGLTADELEAFAAAGAVTARLGPTVLRTSTAGTVAAGILLAHAGRWDTA